MQPGAATPGEASLPDPAEPPDPRPDQQLDPVAETAGEPPAELSRPEAYPEEELPPDFWGSSDPDPAAAKPAAEPPSGETARAIARLQTLFPGRMVRFVPTPPADAKGETGPGRAADAPDESDQE